MNAFTNERLAELTALPLEAKVLLTKQRILDFVQHFNGKCVISFSGGKDSTVLLHIVRELYPELPAVFSNTGLEYPEIQRFARSFPNVDVVTPSMRFDEVISTYGYPLISKEVAEAIYYARRIIAPGKAGGAYTTKKREELCGLRRYGNNWQRGGYEISESQEGSQLRRRTLLMGNGIHDGSKSRFNKEKYLPAARDLPFMISHYCCTKMKKQPIKHYNKAHGVFPILGTLAEESMVRRQAWMRTGCNAFDSTEPKSQPMSFWTEQDVLLYIVEKQLTICSVYGEVICSESASGCKYKCTGCHRTGCIFCGFGLHRDRGESRFQTLAKTHPRQYEYAIGGGQWVDNPHYDPASAKMDGLWQNWNPRQIWVPSKKGLGLGRVFDMTNAIYGKDFFRYE